ncbi:hypothetical protein G5I_00525 [Acromyrmex echinatior]|uniref:Uncharacterized protein n=1 Tax=Acromyrmex echinatior TaxID=103372 RepID=F4W534_ACREC|nr:hypothetical protein G5I_00525 [Acromyrmex echinatior]
MGIVAPPLHFHSILASHVLARFPVPDIASSSVCGDSWCPFFSRVISVDAAQFSRREVADDGGLCTSRGLDPTERADGQTHNENEECPAEPDMKTSLRNDIRAPTDELLCSATIESVDPLIRGLLFSGATKKCREYVHMGQFMARQETLRMCSDGRIRSVTEERCECVSHVTNSPI